MNDEIKVNEHGQEGIDVIEVYKDADGDWRWRRRDWANGEITGASTEGYKNKGEAIDNVVETQAEPYRVDDQS